MDDKELSALKALAEAATPQNFDSAAIKREGGYMDCPTCGGEGAVDVTTDYCNYDGVAIGAAFYGIGPEHLTAEKYYRAANPQAILALISRMEQAEAEACRCRAQAGNTSVDLSGLTQYYPDIVFEDKGIGFANMYESQSGEYVKLTDVQAILAAPARDVGGLMEKLYDQRIEELAHEHGNETRYGFTFSHEGYRTVFTFARAIEREVLATSPAPNVKQEADEHHIVSVLSKLVERVRYSDDCGPAGEGWQSDELERAIADADAIIATLGSKSIAAPSASQGEVSGWISVEDRLPDVPRGSNCEFNVTCKRGHNGKTYVFSAHYLNGLLLQTDDDDCPEEGKPFTGWYLERDDHDYDTAWHPVCQLGDVVTHWMPLPAAPAPSVMDGEKK